MKLENEMKIVTFVSMPGFFCTSEDIFVECITRPGLVQSAQELGHFGGDLRPGVDRQQSKQRLRQKKKRVFHALKRRLLGKKQRIASPRAPGQHSSTQHLQQKLKTKRRPLFFIMLQSKLIKIKALYINDNYSCNLK
jgi:hypothetical protein